MKNSLLSALFFAAIMVCSNNASSQALPFSDNFNDGDDAGWIKPDGNADWAVVGSAYQRGYSDMSSDGRYISFVGDNTWQNYAVSVDTRTLSSSTGWAALLFRVEGGGEFYVFQIEPATNYAKFERRSNYACTIIRETNSLSLNYNTWYNLKAVVWGDSVCCYINNSLIFSAGGLNISSGGAGLASWHMVSEFDNFSATAITGGNPVLNTLCDNFNDGDDAGWIKAEGARDWAVVDGIYTRGYEPMSTDGHYISYTGNSGWLDYSAEVDARTMSSATGWAALLFRILDSGDYYSFQIEPATNYAKLERRTNFEYSILMETNKLSLNYNTWYRMKVSVWSDSVRCYLNDSLVFEYKGIIIGSGAAGLASWHQESQFDNFCVSNISESPNNVAPSNLAYNVSEASYILNQPISTNIAVVSGNIDSFVISSPLPTGLNFDKNTGAISGTPAVVSSHTNYLVTAMNAYGNATCVISIAVTAAPNLMPTNLSYSANPAIYIHGQPILSNTPSVNGDVTSYSVSPSLPDGLNLNASTGVISGIPEAISPNASYIVTASNASGSANCNLLITVNPAPPSGLSYEQNPAIYTLDVTITPNIPALFSGDLPTLYAVFPSLPAGLTIDSATGIITGTATEQVSASNYAVTASNAGGQTQVAVMIEVRDALDSGVVPGLILYSPDPTYDTTPTLSWFGTSGAINYQVLIDTVGDFLAPLIVARTNGATAYTPQTGLPIGKIYWKFSTSLDFEKYSLVDSFEIVPLISKLDINLGVKTVYAQPGDSVWIPVYLTNHENYSISSCQFDFVIDTSVVMYSGASVDSGIAKNWQLAVNSAGKSVIRLGLAGEQQNVKPVTYGEGELLRLKFVVRPDARQGDSSGLVLENILLDDNTNIALSSSPGKIFIGMWDKIYGDVTGNGDANAFDAAKILQYVVGSLHLPDSTVPNFTFEIADVSGSGTITSYDAALVLQYSVGLLPAFPCQYKRLLKKNAAPGSASIALAMIAQNETDGTVFNLIGSGLNGFVAGEFAISYNPQVFKINSGEISTPLAGAVFQSKIDAQNNRLNIAIMTNDDIDETGQVVLARIALPPTTGNVALAFILAQANINEGLITTNVNGSPLIDARILKSIIRNPKPAVNSIRISNAGITILNPERLPVSIALYNLKGSQIARNAFGTREILINLNTEQVAAGTYICRITMGNALITRSILIGK